MLMYNLTKHGFRPLSFLWKQDEPWADNQVGSGPFQEIENKFWKNDSLRVKTLPTHLPLSFMLKTMINRLKNAIGQAITIAISRTQSLYKGNKGSEIKTEKKKLVEL